MNIKKLVNSSRHIRIKYIKIYKSTSIPNIYNIFLFEDMYINIFILPRKRNCAFNIYTLVIIDKEAKNSNI